MFEYLYAHKEDANSSDNTGNIYILSSTLSSYGERFLVTSRPHSNFK